MSLVLEAITLLLMIPVLAIDNQEQASSDPIQFYRLSKTSVSIYPWPPLVAKGNTLFAIWVP
jgi:hypothetical protein